MFSPFVKFRDDNITMLSRTPWAGVRIARRYRTGGMLPDRIGESWEFSFDESFPSRDASTGRTLPEVIGCMPDHWLSAGHLARWGAGSPLLVKVIDAAMDLSVQLHPPLDSAGLRPGECGKWEAWYVLEADGGAGIYLGIRPGIDTAEAVQAIASGDAAGDVLQFIPVRPGEMYMIAPGVVHALGKGVCVLEPQLMLPGRSAVTLRMYDWGRRYDASGHVDPAGRPRELRAHEGIRWFRPLQNVLPSGRFRIPLPIQIETDSFSCRRVFTATGLVMYVMRGSADREFTFPGELKSIIVLAGTVTCSSGSYEMTFCLGESGAIAAGAVRLRLCCCDALCFLTCVAPLDDSGFSSLYMQEILATLR